MADNISMEHSTFVRLTDQQRQELDGLIHSGSAPARVQTRARVLLLADQSQDRSRTDQEVADAALCSQSTVFNIRHRFKEGGLQAALYEKPRPGATPKLTGEVEAELILLACSNPPEGHQRWTLRLLADRMVELNLIDSISHVAVGNRLKQTRLNPGRFTVGASATHRAST
jgi:transposase